MVRGSSGCNATRESDGVTWAQDERAWMGRWRSRRKEASSEGLPCLVTGREAGACGELSQQRGGICS